MLKKDSKLSIDVLDQLPKGCLESRTTHIEEEV